MNSFKSINLKKYNNNILYYFNNKIYLKEKFINDNKYYNIFYYYNKIYFKYDYKYRNINIIVKNINNNRLKLILF